VIRIKTSGEEVALFIFVRVALGTVPLAILICNDRKVIDA
jgi:hypothetical protein